MIFRARAVRSLLCLVAVGCALLWVSGCRRHHERKAKSKPNTTAYADTVEGLVGSPTLAMLRWPNYADDQAAVRKFYDDRDEELAWTRHGRPTEATMEVLQLFENAAQKGLNPQDYDAGDGDPGRWAGRLQILDRIAKKKDDSAAAQSAIATFDVGVTISAMRYLEDLHVGRVNPEALNFDIDVPVKRAAFDVATLLNDRIVDAFDVPEVVESIEPQSPIYKATEQALPTYIALAASEASKPVQPLPPLASGEKPVGLGGRYAALPALWARLQMLGDAAAVTAPESGDASAGGDAAGTVDAAAGESDASGEAARTPQSYNAKMAAAVKQYQERHGLQADGRLGDATIASLNVPMSVRVRQLDDALERWRWMPDNYVQPRVLVNLPEFMLRAYDPDHTLAFKMKVVDGEVKGDHDTPMFVRLMRYVVFRPYWKLPPSIIKKDLVPHVEKSGLGYLESHDYEVYRGDGTVVTNYTAHDLEHLRYNVRQKPGPQNSLGLVKFMLPNAYDVYLHSTPELNLFDLTRRDRSHGCVRLQHADQMALWVLGGDQPDPELQTKWDADSIGEAMNGDDNNKAVGLRTPLPVLIGYFTAMADEDGTMHFFGDLYGYDKQLDEALAKGRPYERGEMKINTTLTPGATE